MSEIYHTLNRGVDKRKIFLDNQDYFRFIHDLFEFNNQQSLSNASYRFNKQSIDIASRYIGNNEKQPRKLMVKILAFCLMPNHYHLLLKPLIDSAIPKFMKKLNIGYAKYFNEKYQRIGTLFQGRYKSVHVTDESHFIHLPFYIHLNPLDLKFPEWRDKEIKNYKEAMKFLESYRWSSFPDYIGKKNFPSVTQRDLLLKFFNGTIQYKKDTEEWLKNLEFENIKEMTLE